MTEGESVMLEELTRTMASAMEQLIENEFELPIKVAVIRGPTRHHGSGCVA
jgi:hypothetical protein